ncbi:dephospho-CoA kinase [Apilactobacillus sp. TMW 2.2459]|uniref:dephospho-CoA kinase n=1 Tax=Apilactobacillus xinyiensis TaxID=2841032 RepID=UPI00200F91EB|nr:dephospho-CoA kinase [Apilactobacillus xinyiensis]MCL0311824.1 dephospho-CoA kinase [Apilactobacillus xinyiensis]
MSKMIIGITGGIATGKSTISKYLLELGYEIIDADKITHMVQSKNSDGLKSIIDYFGKDYLLPNGELNRKKLAKTVFNNSSYLKTLTRIIDPFIRTEVQKRINDFSNNDAQLIFLDAPTLFENGYQIYCDKIITVACSPENQLSRLTERNQISISNAVQIMKKQWPLDYKETLSDFVINSDSSVLQTRSKLMLILNKL